MIWSVARVNASLDFIFVHSTKVEPVAKATSVCQNIYVGIYSNFPRVTNKTERSWSDLSFYHLVVDFHLFYLEQLDNAAVVYIEIYSFIKSSTVSGD